MRSGCPLCKGFHEICIHSRPDRKVRDPDTETDITIKVFVIICNQSKKQGKQYTKRIVPDFVKWYARIQFDLIVAVYMEIGSQLTAKKLEYACLKLGCIDLRTARKHLRDIDEQIKRNNEQLYTFLAMKPGFASLPTEIVPGESNIAILKMLVIKFKDYLQRSGTIVHYPDITVYTVTHHMVYSAKFSISFVWKSGFRCNTS